METLTKRMEARIYDFFCSHYAGEISDLEAIIILTSGEETVNLFYKDELKNMFYKSLEKKEERKVSELEKKAIDEKITEMMKGLDNSKIWLKIIPYLTIEEKKLFKIKRKGLLVLKDNCNTRLISLLDRMGAKYKHFLGVRTYKVPTYFYKELEKQNDRMLKFLLLGK